MNFCTGRSYFLFAYLVIFFSTLSCDVDFKEDSWHLIEPLIKLSKTDSSGILVSDLKKTGDLNFYYLESFIDFSGTSFLNPSKEDTFVDVDVEVKSFCYYDGKEVKKENILFSLEKHKEVFIYQLLPFKLFVESINVAQCRFLFKATNSRNSTHSFEIPLIRVLFQNKENFSQDHQNQVKDPLDDEVYKIRILKKEDHQKNEGNPTGDDEEATQGTSQPMVLFEEDLLGVQFLDQSSNDKDSSSHWRLECENLNLTYKKNSSTGSFSEFHWTIHGENVLYPFLEEGGLKNRNFPLKQNCFLSSHRNHMILSLSKVFFIHFRSKIFEPLVWKNLELKESHENRLTQEKSLDFSFHRMTQVKEISPFDFLDLSSTFRGNEVKNREKNFNLSVLTECFLFEERVFQPMLQSKKLNSLIEERESKDLTSHVLKIKKKKFETKTLLEFEGRGLEFEEQRVHWNSRIRWLGKKEELRFPFFKILPLEVIFNLYSLSLQSKILKSSSSEDSKNSNPSQLNDSFHDINPKIQCNFHFESLDSIQEERVRFNMNGVYVNFHNLDESKLIFNEDTDEEAIQMVNTDQTGVDQVGSLNSLASHFDESFEKEKEELIILNFPLSRSFQSPLGEKNFSPKGLSWWTTFLRGFKENQIFKNERNKLVLQVDLKDASEKLENQLKINFLESFEEASILSNSSFPSFLFYGASHQTMDENSIYHILSDEMKFRIYCADFTLDFKDDLSVFNQERNVELKGESQSFHFFDILNYFHWDSLFQSSVKGPHQGVSVFYAMNPFQLCKIFLLIERNESSNQRNSSFNGSYKMIGFSSPFVIAFPFEIDTPHIAEILESVKDAEDAEDAEGVEGVEDGEKVIEKRVTLGSVLGEKSFFKAEEEISSSYILNFSDTFLKWKEFFHENHLDSHLTLDLDVRSRCFLKGKAHRVSGQGNEEDGTQKTFENFTSWTLSEKTRTHLGIFEILPMKVFLYENQKISCTFYFSVRKHRDLVESSFLKSFEKIKKLKASYKTYNFKILANEIKLHSIHSSTHFSFQNLEIENRGQRTKPIYEIPNSFSYSGPFSIRSTENASLDFFLFKNKLFFKSAFSSQTGEPAYFLSENQILNQLGQWKLECDDFKLEKLNVKGKNLKYWFSEERENSDALNRNHFLSAFEDFVFHLNSEGLKNFFLNVFLKDVNKKGSQSCRLFFHHQNRVQVVSSLFQLKFQEPEAKITFSHPLKKSSLLHPIYKDRGKKCHYFTDESYKKIPLYAPDAFNEDFVLGEIKIYNPHKRELYFLIPNLSVTSYINRCWQLRRNFSNCSEQNKTFVGKKDSFSSFSAFIEVEEVDKKKFQWVQHGEKAASFRLPPGKSLTLFFYIFPPRISESERRRYFNYQKGLQYTLKSNFDIFQIASEGRNLLLKPMSNGERHYLSNHFTSYVRKVIEKDKLYYIRGCISKFYDP